MPKKKGPVSSAAILGNHIKPKEVKIDNKCVNCSKEIPAARISALKSMQVPNHRWTHTQCSTVTKIKGLYLGEVGTSQLQLCDKIYNDSVRSVFRRAENEDSGDDDVRNHDN